MTERAVLLLDLALLLDVEAQVLEERDLAGLQRGAGLLDLGADAVGAGTSPACRAARASFSATGLSEYFAIFCPSGRPEVAHQHQARALAEHVLDGGQRGAQALVVLHLAVLDRHVEVDAHEHALALEVEVLDEELGHGPCPCSCRVS